MWKLISFVLLHSVLSDPNPDGKLVSLIIITNTGARNMIHPEFYSIVNQDKAKENFGRLTNVGRRQHYLLARELAFRYKDFLTSSYPPLQVRAVSASDNCTFESAQAFLMGLYPPGTGSLLIDPNRDLVAPPIKVRDLDKIRKELGYGALPYVQRVIPIEGRTEGEDFLLSPHKNCLKFKEEESKLEDDMDELDISYTSFYNNVLKKLKPSFENIDWNTEYCYKLRDNIQALRGNGYTVDLTITPDEESILEQCAISDILRRLLGGRIRPKLMSYFILREIKTQLEDAMKKKVGLRNVTLYSVNELHITALLKVFGWQINNTIPFAGHLIFELYHHESKKGDEEYTVKAKYNDIELKFPRTKEYANRVVKFINATTFKSEKDYLIACTKSDKTGYDRPFYLAVSLLLWMFFVGVWGTSWYFMLSEDKPEEEQEEIVINY